MSDAGLGTTGGDKHTLDELNSTSPGLATNPFNSALNKEPLVDLAGSVGEIGGKSGSIPGEGPNRHQDLELSDLHTSTTSPFKRPRLEDSSIVVRTQGMPWWGMI